MTSVQGDGAPVKYDETLDPAFSTGLLSWKWEDWEERGTKVGRKTAGACPRCGDRMAIYVNAHHGLDATTVWDCICNCRAPHEGHPPDMSGCGQRARLNLVGWDPEFDDGRTTTASARPAQRLPAQPTGTSEMDPPPLDQPEWDAEARKQARESVAAIRGTAEKWVGSISTLVGVFGAIFVFAGPAALADLKPQSLRQLVFGVLGLAALLAFAAILAGAFAAQGAPRTWAAWDGSALRAYVAKEGRSAQRLLVASRWLGSVAAVIVLATGLLATYATLADPASAPTRALVVGNDGIVICGVLASEDDGTTTVAGETVDAREITIVSSCGE